ncbi:FecR family protein [Mucilaginibacter sp. UR6-11]|uniref:FecR family protein n=1 Tax=Mucilaginibacter sp. UR6-11 TaxID=1435644 RepID=UPI001E5137FA|nr:FecR family protein [Mucilaginibacter sp. UR6-11]MCC8426468.1 DUF4974 domain-containing protein [Mucilaginibacter sp. UR6-11]
MQENFDNKLLSKYNSGQCTDEEKATVESWYLYWKDRRPAPSFQNIEAAKAEVWAALPINKKITRPLFSMVKLTTAAAILIFLGLGGYFILKKQPEPRISRTQPHDIAPGKNQATLTLANGRKIALTKSLNGLLAQQGNTSIRINSGNALVYTASANEDRQTQYNTLSTSRGEQSPYPLVFADGTRVWLNAESSVTYPTAFTGQDRTVKITGEAYFEVAHQTAKPFRVICNGQTVEDIGTRFDINAYADEPNITTTLLEGAIRVSAGGHHRILTPGQQAVTGSSHQIELAKNADMEQVLAWKEGRFIFIGESLESIMRKISRWYNVEVVYRSQPAQLSFDGSVSRAKNISAVLEIMKSTGNVHFEVQGRRIMVTTR